MFDIKEYRELCERIGKLHSDLQALEARRSELEHQMQMPPPPIARPSNSFDKSSQNAPQPKLFDPDAPPRLTHTKLLSAKLSGNQIREVKWNGLLDDAIRMAKAKARDERDLQRLVTINFKLGRKEDEGYRFLSDIGLSVQGQDADHAWRGARHIARQLGISIEAEFVWRSKPEAAYPGETGRLSA